MNYIVFDLEWNQSPKGKEGAIDHLPFEIIEIGAIKLDENRNPIGEFQQLVSPSVYSQIHYKISEVTHLDMKTLQREGVPFFRGDKQLFGLVREGFLVCDLGVPWI